MPTPYVELSHIYSDQIEDPKMQKASGLQQHITWANPNKIHILNSKVLHADPMQDITCKKLALQSHCSDKNTFKTVGISANGIIQKQQYIVILCSVALGVARFPIYLTSRVLYIFIC